MERQQFVPAKCIGRRQMQRRVTKAVGDFQSQCCDDIAFKGNLTHNNLKLFEAAMPILENINDTSCNISSTEDLGLSSCHNADDVPSNACDSQFLNLLNVESVQNCHSNLGCSKDCEGESETVSSVEKNNLSDSLKNWANDFKITTTALTKLLHLLSPFHPELPLDSRTLLRTPLDFNSKELETGQYSHFGLQKGLYMFLESNINFKDSTISISFNIDGLPLFNSSNVQVWPILALIKNEEFFIKPFPVGVFCGNAKPKPLAIYLEDFLNELLNLIENGLLFKNKLFKINIHSFICDAPARAYLKCVKSHNGYSSCDKCVNPGEYFNGRIIFTKTDAAKRTDASFVAQEDEDHHLGISPLLKIPVGLVSQFPSEYMHSTCLGVMKKLLNAWISRLETVHSNRNEPQTKGHRRITALEGI
ncbi:unnamed protein product [Brassicogethes aeneus]|uniref:Transposase domain-containing protein n=1 Tax=Brassicogethes aeneus TaxID=1431903 RepID=A0A9P0BAK4_BRAAE|nr:unnamed protein product [Brassicogethes aeneus]